MAIAAFDNHDWATIRSETGGPTTRLTCTGLTSTKKYLVYYRAQAGSNDASANSTYVQCTFPDGTTAYMARYETASAGHTGQFYHYLWYGTSSGTDPSIQSYETSTYTQYVMNMSIVAIELDNLVEDQDYWCATDASGGAHTAGSWVTMVSKTLTPQAGDDLLILAWADLLVDNTSYQTDYRIYDGSAAVNGQCSYEGEDTAENLGIIQIAVVQDTTASSRTYSLQAMDESGSSTTNDTGKSLIFVLRLDSLASHICATGSNSSASAGWNDVVDAGTYSPTSTGDQVIVSFFNCDVYSTAAYTSIGLQVAGADEPADGGYGVYANDDTDIFGYSILSVKSIPSTGNTLKLRGYTDNTGVDFLNGVLAAFSVATYSAATTYSGWAMQIY